MGKKRTNASPFLNMRSGRSLKATVFRKLPLGTIVEVLSKEDKEWTKIEYDGAVGYVATQYLEDIPDIESPVKNHKFMVSEVHLYRPKLAVSLDETPNAFSFDHNVVNFNNVKDAIEFLKVETSLRYKRLPTATYCNIYLHDLMRVLGLYIPRVWWTGNKHAVGDFVKPVYGSNVIDINANAITDWLDFYGKNFGWKIVSDKQIKDLPDNHVGVICARNNEGIGHVTAVVGKDFLQSQAGRVNQRYFTDKNWFRRSQFEKVVFAIHEL